MFHSLRDSGHTVEQAAEACWERYPYYRVVSYEKWKPTKGNDAARRGPVPKPWRMTQKTGPDRKMSKAMVKDAKQLLKTNPMMNNAAIAQHLNWY